MENLKLNNSPSASEKFLAKPKNRRVPKESASHFLRGKQKEFLFTPWQTEGFAMGPACCPAKRDWGWEAFSQFLRQQEGKTEKFSFP
jgi:hypothetical protein